MLGFFSFADKNIYLNCHDIPEPDPKIVADNSVHSDLLVCDRVVRQDNANALLPLLALQNIRVELSRILAGFLAGCSKKFVSLVNEKKNFLLCTVPSGEQCPLERAATRPFWPTRGPQH
jgi:hypothetical protein